MGQLHGYRLIVNIPKKNNTLKCITIYYKPFEWIIYVLKAQP